MIIEHISQPYGPGVLGAIFSAFVWMISMFILLYHRSGMQVVGGLIFFVGLGLLVANAQVYLALPMLLIGFGMHGIGRFIYRMKHRRVRIVDIRER